MSRTDAITWVVNVRTLSLRLSQAKTLAVLVASATRVQRVSLANGIGLTALSTTLSTTSPGAGAPSLPDGDRLVASADVTMPGQDASRLSLSYAWRPEHGAWVAARAYAGPDQVAHTTPVYLTVDGGGFENPNTYEQRLDQSASYLDELEAIIQVRADPAGLNAWRYRDALQARIDETRQVIEGMREK